MSNISASLFRAMNISQVSNFRISSNSTEILYDITLFGPQDWGCLLHTHRHWALLQVIPAPHGTDGLSLFLHWHWHRSGFHSSNSKSQSFGPWTHSHPQRVWFFTCVVRISSVHHLHSDRHFIVLKWNAWFYRRLNMVTWSAALMKLHKVGEKFEFWIVYRH